jgi:hypothetical protein
LKEMRKVLIAAEHHSSLTARCRSAGFVTAKSGQKGASCCGSWNADCHSKARDSIIALVLLNRVSKQSLPVPVPAVVSITRWMGVSKKSEDHLQQHCENQNLKHRVFPFGESAACLPGRQTRKAMPTTATATISKGNTHTKYLLALHC